MKTKFAGILFYLLLSVTVCSVPAFGIDLGSSSSSAASADSASASDESGSGQVEVTNLPVQYLKKKINHEDVQVPHLRVLNQDQEIREVAKEIALSADETYESEPMDVREYRDISFFVVPDQVLMGQSAPAVYQLDAFFSMTPNVDKIQRLGASGQAESLSGWSEFGAMRAGEKEGEDSPAFVKLTTGRTSSRVLTMKTYGPFVRVVLKNFTADSKRKYKIVAYLTR